LKSGLAEWLWHVCMRCEKVMDGDGLHSACS
jgi:hypothetical protein